MFTVQPSRSTSNTRRTHASANRTAALPATRPATTLPVMPIDRTAADRLAAAAARLPGLRLLVLHGSRARDNGHPASDWDFAYLADDTLDPAALTVALADELRTDAIDLGDLARASAVLRWHVARDGVALYECRTGAWHAFRVEAIDFWCDAGPTIRAAQAAFLQSLGPAPVGATADGRSG